MSLASYMQLLKLLRLIRLVHLIKAPQAVQVGGGAGQEVLGHRQGMQRRRRGLGEAIRQGRRLQGLIGRKWYGGARKVKWAV